MFLLAREKPGSRALSACVESVDVALLLGLKSGTFATESKYATSHDLLLNCYCISCTALKARLGFTRLQVCGGLCTWVHCIFSIRNIKHGMNRA